MDEPKITSQPERPQRESDIEDLEVGTEADRVSGGASAAPHRSGDPEEGGN